MVRGRPRGDCPSSHPNDLLPPPFSPVRSESPLRDFESYEREEADHPRMAPLSHNSAPSGNGAGASTTPKDGGTPYPSKGEPPAPDRISGPKRARKEADEPTRASKRVKSKSQDAGADINNGDPRLRARQAHKRLKHTPVPANLHDEEYFRRVQERVRAWPEPVQNYFQRAMDRVDAARADHEDPFRDISKYSVAHIINLHLNTTDLDISDIDQWELPQVTILERRMGDAWAPILNDPDTGRLWHRLHKRANALFNTTYRCVMPAPGTTRHDAAEYRRLRLLLGAAVLPALQEAWGKRMDYLAEHERLNEAGEAISALSQNGARAREGDTPEWPRWSSHGRAYQGAHVDAGLDGAAPAQPAPHGLPGPFHFHVLAAPIITPHLLETPPSGAELAAELGFDGAQANLPGHYCYIKSLGRGSFGEAGLWYKYDNQGRIRDRIVIKDAWLGRRHAHGDDWDNKNYYWLRDRLTGGTHQIREIALVERLSALPDSSTIVKHRGHALYPQKRVYRIYMQFLELGNLTELYNEHVNVSLRADEHGRQVAKQRIPKQEMWSFFEALVGAGCLMRRGALPGQQEPEHWRSIVHHDLKPDNIFMSKPDDQVGDFGLAHPIDSETVANPRGMACGTQGWKAPEQFLYTPEAFAPKRSSATNVWAIGRIMQHLMTLDNTYPEDILFDTLPLEPGQGPEPRFAPCPACSLTTAKNSWTLSRLARRLVRRTAYRWTSCGGKSGRTWEGVSGHIMRCSKRVGAALLPTNLDWQIKLAESAARADLKIAREELGPKALGRFDHFFDLPPELGTHILAYVVAQAAPVYDICRIFDIPIFSVGRQLQIEALSISLVSHTFDIVVNTNILDADRIYRYRQTTGSLPPIKQADVTISGDARTAGMAMLKRNQARIAAQGPSVVFRNLNFDLRQGIAPLVGFRRAITICRMDIRVENGSVDAVRVMEGDSWPQYSRIASSMSDHQKDALLSRFRWAFGRLEAAVEAIKERPGFHGFEMGDVAAIAEVFKYWPED